MNSNELNKTVETPELEEGGNKEMFGCCGVFIMIPVFPFILEYAGNIVMSLIAAI